MKDFEQKMRDVSYPFAMGSTSRGVWLEPAIRIMREAVTTERDRYPKVYHDEEIRNAPDGDYAIMYNGEWEEVDTKEFCVMRIGLTPPTTFYGPLPTQDSEVTDV